MTTADKFWDKMADGYAKSPIADVPAYEYTLGRTKSYLSKTDKVLEIGCGTGSTAILLAPEVAHITATDFAARMVEIGQGKADAAGITNIDLAVADASGPPAGPFDAIMAFNLLHLVTDPAEVLAGVHERLKPGGMFISKTTCKPEGTFSLKFSLMMMAVPVLRVFGKAPYVNIPRIAELEAMIEAAGFSIIETGNYPKNPPGRYVVARKL